MIAWWCSSPGLDVASTRLRAFLVMRALRGRGLEVGWYEPGASRRCDALVLVKRYDDATFAEARRLRERGCRIVADLCDNHFFNPDGEPDWKTRAEQLRRLVEHSDRVVAATSTLADVIAAECPRAPRAVVIGDLVDDLDPVPVPTIRRWQAAAALSALRLRALLRPGRTRLVWFGNAGAHYAGGGMLDLLRLREPLEALDRTRPVSLTVISNHRRRYRKHIAPWRISTAYLEWEASTFASALAAHEVALIPVSRNGFTLCKTDNRVVTSLSHGLAVIADAIPSYEPYRQSIVLDDWESGWNRYVGDVAARRAQDVALGMEVVRESTDAARIAARWHEVITGD